MNTEIFYSAVGLLSSILVHVTMVVVLWVMANLSLIMGKALKKKSYYKTYYLACGFLLMGQVILLAGFRSITFLLDILALILASGVTWYYWKWLPKDLLKG